MRGSRGIQSIYMDLEQSLAELIDNSEDAFFIIWFNIFSWIEPKNPEWWDGICEELSASILGIDIGARVYFVKDNPHYQDILARYGFGESAGELGKSWKNLLRNEDIPNLRRLLGCLKIYYEEFMPYVKKVMLDYFERHGRNYPDLEPTLNPYNEHRKKIKKTMDIIKMALDIFTL